MLYIYKYICQQQILHTEHIFMQISFVQFPPSTFFDVVGTKDLKNKYLHNHYDKNVLRIVIHFRNFFYSFSLGTENIQVFVFKGKYQH